MQEKVLNKCFQFIDTPKSAISRDRRVRSGIQLLGRFSASDKIEEVCGNSAENIEEHEFKEICKSVPGINQEILLVLLKSLDYSNRGFILLEDLRDVCEKFDDFSDFDELEQHFLQVGCCRGGKLYYDELIPVMLQDQEKVEQKLLLFDPTHLTEEKEESVSSLPSESPAHKTDSDTTAKSSDAETSEDETTATEEPELSTSGPGRKESVISQDEIARLRAQKCFKLKGCFLYDEDEPDATKKLVSHQFQLHLPEPGEYTITMEPYSPGGGERTNGNVDTLFFVANESNDIIGFSDIKFSEGLFGYKCDLIEGRYRIIPFTTTCRFRPVEGGDPGADRVTLLETTNGGSYQLQKTFRMALMNMLEMCDLDGNGCLSRSEFNLFNIRTGDEHVTDEEWSIVQQNFECRDGDLTLKGFMEMHQLEANESHGDTEDMWLSLKAMGFNNKLQLENAVPFILSISSTNPETISDIKFIPYEVQPLQQPWLDSIVDYWGRESFVWQSEGGINIRIVRYDWLAVVLVQNLTEHTITKELGASVNEQVSCIFTLRNVVVVVAHSAMLAAFFMPNEGIEENWNFDIAFE